MPETHQPACDRCLDGDHSHCKDWVWSEAQQSLVYCQCGWHRHQPV